MRSLLIAASLLTLSGCSLLMPTPDPNRAWIDLDTNDKSDLEALKVDNKPWDTTSHFWDSSRYFEVDPGQHELRVRFQFQVDPSDIGPAQPALWRKCQLTLQYPDFAAGQRYRLQAGNVGFRPWARLYDDQSNEVARGKERGCDGASATEEATAQG